MDALADEMGPRTAQLGDLRRIRRSGERGRPPGSTNKRQEKTAQWFMRMFGSPLAVLGEVMTMPPDVLMTQMQALQGGDAKHKPLRALDIFKLKMEAAEKAAPYVHSKMPVELHVSDARDFILNIPGLVIAPETLGGGNTLGPVDLIEAMGGADVEMQPISSDWVDTEGGDQ